MEILMFRGKSTLLLQLRVGLPGCLVPGEEAGEGWGVGEQQVGSTPKTSHPGEAPPRASRGLPVRFAASVITLLVCLAGCYHQTMSHPVFGFN